MKGNTTRSLDVVLVNLAWIDVLEDSGFLTDQNRVAICKAVDDEFERLNSLRLDTVERDHP
jgi:hypothetical protein